MALLTYADSALSLLPPVIAIGMAIVTRKVLLSLGLGIAIGVLMLTGFAPMEAASNLGGRVQGLFWSEGAPSAWNLYTLGFLLLLGVMTALISVSGATRAFADWARQRIRCGRDAKLMTIALGVVIFIDDYFNTLVVGSVARPVTDHYQVSREKLAYCIDSTSAPICVISPISSWGAYIIALIGGLLTTHGVTDIGYLSAFIQMVPMNFYAVFAFALLLAVVYFGLDVGPMAQAEQRARRGQLWDETKGAPAGEELDLPEADNGRVWGLLAPIGFLILLTVTMMLYSGGQALAADGKSFSVIGAFENTDVAWSLFYSALAGVLFTAGYCLQQRVPVGYIVKALFSGLKSMMPAIYILLFAWTIAGVISDMETGKYMASMAQGNLPTWSLPALLFLLSGFAAFATGTSWGTFAIMLPIAANMAEAVEITMMLPMLASVLAGAVFGDHCSPISDTTILSSTGAACHHIDHVTTQLPYAVMTAIISLVGYLVLGITGSTVAGFACASVALVIVVTLLKRRCEPSCQ
ncbi:Na+/H+ antiporter NhaC family protein [Ferrimonas aestuarii]|uniref:Na+/H+ antiporter NhaC family protein n=1 Tax=Ferrimonas aestuarii TaxID=2569539 RepID=A0A4U1BHG9_9GAMM|nr:Na+/H+ antiporter NhaC family protein [Ferrimonas aestuarii]TKB50828.1 Na+/H+ antiporter NhaC family protein [Ferrimonas aestuarii]